MDRSVTSVTSGNGSLPVKLSPSNLRPIAYRILSKKHGLNIKTDALSLLTEVISFKYGFDWKGVHSQQFIEEIAKIWKLEDRGIFIDGPGLKQVIREINNKTESSTASRSSSTETEGIVAGRSDTIVDNNESEEQSLNWEDFFKFINPSDQTPCKFDKQRKQFTLTPHGRHDKKTLTDSLNNYLQSSIELFNNRYNLLYDRLSRNENFQKTSYSSISSISRTMNHLTSEITLIKNVLGRDGSKFILFGLLSKGANDEYVLEDSSDYIELNLSQAYKTQGSFYFPGMFVIVEGIYSASGGLSSNRSDYIGGCFHVSNIGHPPAERREISNENYGYPDFLGIHKQSGDMVLKVNKALRKKLVSLERSLHHHKFIFLGSECNLDNFKILDGLKKFFNRLENSIIESNDEDIPLALVLTGSFSSKPLTGTSSTIASVTNSELYKGYFDDLSTLVSQFPNVVQKVKFVLIPGKNDPWQSSYSLGSSNSNYFPQTSIPRLFVNRLERLLPKGHLILSWNPTRINYLSQEIVILKDELISKFKRNDIIFESDLQLEKELVKLDESPERINHLISQEQTEHISPKIKQARKLVKTLLDQGHLQPFLKELKLVNPDYDYALRIEPLPTVLILHDENFDNFEITYNGCKVINITKLVSPTNRKLNFVEYTPCHKKFDFKELYF
ncbi:DNA-directed DNA polymerase epsilon, subunit B [Scheffersomyces amazonensis]|uniref:DNA-directed DNA polymerase epsilon, subunit B n=1 Tax=Scheffersomyces amazonensis TaxID=1078765 RepID=UPI00315C6AA7